MSSCISASEEEEEEEEEECRIRFAVCDQQYCERSLHAVRDRTRDIAAAVTDAIYPCRCDIDRRRSVH